MGTRAAMKKAIMLLTDVRATLVPVRRKQSPVLSLKKKSQIEFREEKKRTGVCSGVGMYLNGTLKGMLVPASVKE